MSLEWAKCLLDFVTSEISYFNATFGFIVLLTFYPAKEFHEAGISMQSIVYSYYRSRSFLDVQLMKHTAYYFLWGALPLGLLYIAL